MENKKIYETPEVTKVEFDASDRVTASNCQSLNDTVNPTHASCDCYMDH